MDDTGAPSTYDELFEQYFGFVKGLLFKLGIKDTEDYAQEVMIRFMERGFLEVYDPSVVRNGRPTSFKAFLRAFVERYSMGWRERQQTIAGREPIVCDLQLPSGMLWVEVYAPQHLDPTDHIGHEEGTILLIRERLSEIPVRGKRDLVKLWDLVLPQIRDTGKIDRKHTAEKYGVSTTVIGSMLEDLRQAISYLSPTPAW